MFESKNTTYFFVDESGDSTFFNKKGECLLDQNLVSPILILGFITTNDPISLRRELIRLKEEIITDEYLQAIPSLTKTKIAFHAKDDAPEVREKVFKLLKTLDYKAEFIVARKRLDIFIKRHKKDEDIFYNELIARLFERKLHKQNNVIYFSKRGNKLKQKHIESAIQTAVINFEYKHNTKVESDTKVLVQVPSDEPCLQIIDYMNWIVQRAFIRQEMRYFDYLREKVSFICDIYDFDKYPNSFYSKSNPFDAKKITPL